ncbi:right-handed parallel beta-helix repeat-containing protein [Pseudoalteromonas sp. 120-MNA-CIBAN-0494]|uniref:right-handed parallel beta-helix repeat-containing protein n=2 Tax=Pseudoalteromonas TaxID=53246 RepID=UPI0033283513
MHNILYFLFVFSLSIFSAQTLSSMIPDDGVDDSQSLKELILNTAENSELIIEQPGIYDICSAIILKNISNVVISAKKGVILRKCDGFEGEYILAFYNSRFITLEGFTFEGLTKDPVNYAWGEQGILFAGSSDISVRYNQFFNFGDAAIRATSSHLSSYDAPINSFRVKISNNYFENITQVTTTHPWNNNFGGTHDITVENNIFEGLKGSLKFASVKPVSKALIIYNTFKNTKGTAIELTYYSNVKIIANSFVDTNKFILNAYPNKPRSVNTPFNWGNIYFVNNTIIRAKGGIRIQSDVTGELIDDEYVRGIYINNNHFLDIDMTVYPEKKYWDLINLFSRGGKSYIFSTIKDNTYNLLPEVNFVKKTNGFIEKNNTLLKPTSN